MATRRETEIARRGFLASMAALGVPFAAPPALLALDAVGRAPSSLTLAADFPRNEPSRVQSVVGASHSNFDVLRDLVTEQPALAKASWDWGFGDWESALGAASHTGRRPIAEFLIAHGARPTIFSAAMLGQVDTVRAYLTADPTLFELDGPHGITLLAHARAGGADAERVLDYLSETFGTDEAPIGFAGDAEVEARYAGRYRFDTEPPTEIGVGVRNGFLLVGAGEQPNSRVRRVEEHAFHPTGAPAVRLRFDVVDGRARSMTIEDGPVRITGARAAE
jgi:hypothetical protein